MDLEIGNIYRYFDKTPSDINCPHFWMFAWANGCPFKCSYCYLQGTFYGKTDAKKTSLDKLLEATDMMFKLHKEPHLFNSGELSESMMFPEVMMGVLDRFEEQDMHKILLLTKSGLPRHKRWYDYLLKRKYRQVVMSFSINSMEAYKRWELNTASPLERLDAGKAMVDMGYDVRVRYDPMFPFDGWEEEYSSIVDETFKRFEPERITLGTPRGLGSTIRNARERTWTEWFVKDQTGWGKKIPDKTRIKMYMFMKDKIREYTKISIGICKETWAMWELLGWDGKNNRCNCVW